MLGFILILMVFSVSSAVPRTTGLDDMWISDKATEFWFMNDPDEELKNDVTVFHYDSDFNLIKSFRPDLSSYAYDFTRLNRSRWAVLHKEEIQVFNSSWDFLKSKNISDKIGAGDPVKFIEKNGTKIVVEEGGEYPTKREEKEYYTYKLNQKTLEVGNRSSVDAIEPDEYPPREGEWIRYDNYVGSESVKLREGYNYTKKISLHFTDGEISNRSIWMIESHETGATLYKYTSEMKPTNNSYSVGLNETQVQLTEIQRVENYLAFLMLILIPLLPFILFLGGLAAVIYLIYALIKNDEE